jgi:hypothetical protein
MTPERWEDIDHNPTWLGCKMMERTLEDMCSYCRCIERGDYKGALLHTRLAMFCSAPGLGKTYTGRSTLRRGGVRLRSYDYDPSTRASLTDELWDAVQAKYGAIIMNDADLLMRSDSMIGMMKSAWENVNPMVRCSPTKEIRKNHEYKVSGDPRHKDTIPDPMFPLYLACAWFSNKRLDTADARHAAGAHHDFEALIDRGLRPVWIDSVPRNVCFHTVWMICRGNLFRNLGLSVQEQTDTLDFFIMTATGDGKNVKGHPSPNLRLALDLAKARRNPDYRAMWARIVAASLAGREDEPKALDIRDLTGARRPDLAKEIERSRTRITHSAPPSPLVVPNGPATKPKTEPPPYEIKIDQPPDKPTPNPEPARRGHKVQYAEGLPFDTLPKGHFTDADGDIAVPFPKQGYKHHFDPHTRLIDGTVEIRKGGGRRIVWPLSEEPPDIAGGAPSGTDPLD